MATNDTLPKILLSNYQKWGSHRVAMRKKAFGIWKEFTWADVYENVKYLSLALLSNDFKPGDNIATLGDNSPQLFWAELAAQAAGGAMTAIPSDCLPDEVKYQTRHADAKFVIAEDQEQVDKIIKISNELPLLKKVIYWDPKGLKGYDDPLFASYDDFLQQGREYGQLHLELFEQKVAETSPDDVALILYTSGTTGLPRGAMVKHKTFITWVNEMLKVFPVSENDNTVSFMLPGWIVEQMLGFGNMLLAGVTMNFPEEPETVQADLREIAPSIILYPSRLWERLNTEIHMRVRATSFIKRAAFNLFAPVGYRFADLTCQKKKPNLLWSGLYAIGNQLLFRPLKDKHGLSNVRHAITCGATLSPDIIRFLQAMGINIKQIYALTETGLVTSQCEGDIEFESVGVPVGKGKKIRISQNGEVLIDAAHCFDGYYDNGRQTEAFQDGWFHSGDAGRFLENGHLIYLDRIADIKELGTGTRFSPQHIESRLKSSPYIIDAMVVSSDSSNFAAAIIHLNLGIVSKWAGGRNITYSPNTDLSQNPEVCELIRQEVAKVNQQLPEDSRIRKFINIRKEFDPDEAELTRTRKIRRAFLEHRYRNLIDAIYSGKQEFVEKTTVTYQNGSKSTVESVIRVNNVGD